MSRRASGLHAVGGFGLIGSRSLRGYRVYLVKGGMVLGDAGGRHSSCLCVCVCVQGDMPATFEAKIKTR